MNEDCESLEEFLGVIPEHLGPYHLEDMYLIQDKTIEWNTNWKASVDAFNEVYHVQGIHPQILESLDDVNVQIDLYERHNRYLVPFGLVSPRYPNQDEVTSSLKGMMLTAGIDPETFEGNMADVRPAMQVATRAKAEAAGMDFSDLNDDQMTDDYHYYIFPNLTFNTHAGGVMMFRQRPHPTDPNKMFYDLQNFALIPAVVTHNGADAGAGQRSSIEPPPRPKHETFKHGEISLGLGLDQDSYNLPRVQKGMKSKAYKGLLINYRERRIRHMHKTLTDYVEGPDR
jgi:hypothetical protein